MEILKFFAITHREHVVCNPTSEEKLARLVGLLRLPAGARVVDIASGTGELLVRLAETYRIRGVGVDLSPFFVAEARRRLQLRAPEAEVTFLEMDGAKYRSEAPRSLAMASCIGASWVFGGHAGTLDALADMVAPGGWVVVGEPFWKEEPAAEYLAAAELERDAFGTHLGNVAAGEARGLELVHTLVSSLDDWDRYEGLQWYAAADYAAGHPDDPDLPELAERVARTRTAYLRWGRECLGWAIYLFRQRESGQ